MRTLPWRVLCVLLVVPASAEAQSLFRAKVMAVHDGDTYRVLREDGRLTDVRLWGVDAPELGQPYGATVQQTVQRLIGGQTVRVSVEDHDRHGRPVARMEVEGGDLSTLLVRRGLAWHDDIRAPNAEVLMRLEQRARRAGRGLWSLSTPTPPWEWRDRDSTSGPSPPETHREPRAELVPGTSRPSGAGAEERRQPLSSRSLP